MFNNIEMVGTQAGIRIAAAMFLNKIFH